MRPPKVLDNKRFRVVDELRAELGKGSKLSVISAHFTIYAYAELKKELSKIDGVRFIFTEPAFVPKDHEFFREYYIVRNPEKKYPAMNHRSRRGSLRYMIPATYYRLHQH